MVERITVNHLKRYLPYFAKAVGMHVATSYNDVGGLRIDSYNGYMIEAVLNKGGGVDHPFGTTRMTARELLNAMHFAERAINLRYD